MSWSPISGTIPQYQKSDGTLASDYYIKFYQSGTTTSFSMATSSTGGTTLDKCQLDSSGYPTTDGTTRFIPHVNQKYKIILYKNSTDADANTTGNADWIIDAVEQTQTSGSDAWVLFSGAPTYVSATTFTLTGDQTSTFTVGTRLKFTDATTLYGIITASVYTSLTTVTVTLDSGSLSGSLTAVYHGISTTVGKEISTATISHLNTDIATTVIYELEALLNSYPVSVLLLGAVAAGDLYQALTDAVTYNVPHVWIPAGEWTLSGNFVIDRAIRIDGAGGHGGETNRAGKGPVATQITCTGSSGSGIELDAVDGVSNTIANIHLSNFILVGNANMDGGLTLGKTANQFIVCSTFKNITVKDFTKTGAYAVRFKRILQSHFENIFTFNNYDGYVNLSGDVATTLTTMNCYSGSNLRYGVFFEGAINGCSFYEIICESNFSSALVMNGNGVSTNNFYTFYAEDNNRTLGAAPIEVGTSGASSPIYCNFFGGNIVSGDVAGLYLKLDRADRVNFYDFILPSYTAGFMSVTANTTTSRFRTFANAVSTDVTGNHSNGMYIDYPTPKKKMGTLTYDLSTASGTTAVTGLGFEPSIIHIMAAVDNTTLKCSGYSDGTTNYVISDTHGTTAETHAPLTSFCIQLVVDGSNYVRGTIGSITHDGFTITWTKTGSPTGSAVVMYALQG
jgi:hypothetical protein